MDHTMVSREEEKGTECTHEGGCECSPQKEMPRVSHEELSFAFLLALMPLVVLTFFGQAGLI